MRHWQVSSTSKHSPLEKLHAVAHLCSMKLLSARFLRSLLAQYGFSAALYTREEGYKKTLLAPNISTLSRSKNSDLWLVLPPPLPVIPELAATSNNKQQATLQTMAVAITKAPTMSLAAVRPATPRPSSCTSQQLPDDLSTSWFDKQLRKTTTTRDTPEKESKKKKKVKTSRISISFRSSELSVEAEQLKQQIRRKWPVSLFKFKLRFMKRVVVAPVPIPTELSHSRAWAAMVSGIRIPLTKMMWLRQRRKLLYRMPDTIYEDVGY